MRNLLIRTIPPAGCILNLYSTIRPRAYVIYIYIYIYLFLLIVLLAVFLCRFLLVACLANRAAALQTVVGSSARLLWESKYLADFKIV